MQKKINNNIKNILWELRRLADKLGSNELEELVNELYDNLPLSPET